MTVTGPDFVALQVSDLERSATFYENHFGLTRVPGPPGAVVFATEPIPFAVRVPLPDTDLDAGPRGLGTALWMHTSDAQELHDRLAEAGVPILAAPAPGPFGLSFACADPDGYRITLHDGADEGADEGGR